MITDRDREIINYIDKYKYATIDQIANVFFNDSFSKYELSRRRLKCISDTHNYIKSFRNSSTNTVVYTSIDNNIKSIKDHDLKIMDYIAKLYVLGCNIRNVTMANEWSKLIPEVVPDSLIKLEFKSGTTEYQMFHILEMQLRHDRVDINRYNNIIPKIMNLTGNVMPRLIIIQNTNMNYKDINETPMKVFQLDLTMQNIHETIS